MIQEIIVTNIETFLSALPTLSEKVSGNYMYRGHGNKEWKLLPSVMRNNYLKNEDRIYNYVLTECAEEFKGMISHAEILAKMQHYGVPTRLLDLTENPLVALFFACSDDSTMDGAVLCININDRNRIRPFDSDTATILSCLARCSEDEKKEILNAVIDYKNSVKNDINNENSGKERFNKKRAVKRILFEICKENPTFGNSFTEPLVFLKKTFFLPKKSNPRIIRQSGAFMLFGLENQLTAEKDENDLFINKIIVDNQSKLTILKQLAVFGISKATLFPEMYKVAENAKEKFRIYI